MTLPIWLDESGRPRPTRPCPRCGREAPVFRFRVGLLRLIGWQPYQVATFVNWCGHGQEVIPWPAPDGSVRLVPVVGEAT